MRRPRGWCWRWVAAVGAALLCCGLPMACGGSADGPQAVAPPAAEAQPSAAAAGEAARPVEPEGPLWGDRPAEPLDLRAAVSPEQVELLGEVLWTVDLYTGPGTSVELAPEVPEGFAGTVERRPPVPLGEGTWQRFAVWLRPTRVGSLTIPSLRVEAAGGGPVATSREASIQVVSVLGGAGAEVEPPAPPFPPPLDLTPWLAGACAAVGVAALWWWWRRARRRPRPQVVETPPPPHVTALRALAKLRHAPRSTAPQVEQFYVEVSRILRVYLEARFALRAPEQTTEEFLASVSSGEVLTVEQRLQLGEFLNQCDLVKFARALPEVQVHERTFAIAEGFVEATRADRAREGAA